MNLGLDKIPVATWQAIAGYVLVIIAYASHDIGVLQAFLAVGVNTAGAGILGHARNDAGRGVR